MKSIVAAALSANQVFYFVSGGGRAHMITREDSLDYHRKGRKGKIEVITSKPCITQKDLSMAYTPGVAEPCWDIEKNADDAYQYTAKGNLVAVVTNGTAVLGLGDIGPLAGKPVMEGKGVLFKRFADIDVFDLEVNTKDSDELIRVVELLEPTFGGINLEDIKAPECFYIEEKLKKSMSIPVFHDDQHGTAIISGAALLNGMIITGKKIEDIIIVVCGAGAAGIACAKHYVNLGAKKEHIILLDSTGVVYRGRTKGMNPYKEEFAQDTPKRTLAEALEGADVFVGVSSKNLVSQDMVRSMAPNPIIFAMANPDPEISYHDAKAAREDIIMATGRSDYPNQVNNVLGFPFIFRGALDVRATTINEEMKMAATKALAVLAKEDIPDSVLRAYGVEHLSFGPGYIIPKPLDPRVLFWVAPAVAKAAMDSGVAQVKISDLDAYRNHLESLLGKSLEVMRGIITKARCCPKRIVFPEGENVKILRACNLIVKEGVAHPILLGRKEHIRNRIKELGLDIPESMEIHEPALHPRLAEYAHELYALMKRKGVTQEEALHLLQNVNVFGAMMVHLGDADGLLSGIAHSRSDIIKPALQIIGLREGFNKAAGLIMMILKEKVLFFADPSMIVDPTVQDLAEIAMLAADCACTLGFSPRVAMLSFSSFGSVEHPLADKVRVATLLVKSREPSLVIDGEMQVDPALLPELMEKQYPFSDLQQEANVLIFPDLQSANISYKLLHHLADATAVGPLLLGMKKPVQTLQRNCEVNDVLNMAAITVLDAIERGEK